MGPESKLFLSVFLISCSSGAILGRSETKKCVHYNYSPSSSSSSSSEFNISRVITCSGEKDKRLHCFATWKNISGAVKVVKQGCWLDDVNCYNRTECVEKKDGPEVFFCCCDGILCNDKFFYSPNISWPPTTNKPVTSPPPLLSTLMYSLVPIMAVTAIVLFSFWMYRHHKLAYPPVLVPTQDSGPLPPSPIVGHKPLQLLEIKSRGSFGCVWKAQLLSEYVAVKIFQIQGQPRRPIRWRAVNNSLFIGRRRSTKLGWEGCHLDPDHPPSLLPGCHLLPTQTLWRMQQVPITFRTN